MPCCFQIFCAMWGSVGQSLLAQRKFCGVPVVWLTWVSGLCPPVLNPSVLLIGQNFSTQVAPLTLVWVSLPYRAVLCIFGWLAAAPGPYPPDVSSTHCLNYDKMSLAIAKSPLGAKLPPLGTTGLKIFNKNIKNHIPKLAHSPSCPAFPPPFFFFFALFFCFFFFVGERENTSWGSQRGRRRSRVPAEPGA